MNICYQMTCMKKTITHKLRRSKTHVAKKSRFLLRHPLILPVTTFIFLFFIGLILLVIIGSSTQGAADTRIVNLFVAGEKRTLTTRAETVGDLISRIDDVELQDADIVEPSKESLILEDDMQINIYRARVVEMLDGDRVLTVFTAQRAPRLVAQDAGVDLLPEDDAMFVLQDSTALESTATEQLEITRSVGLTLNTYGAVRAIRTTAPTVGELLEREGIQPQDGESVQPSLDTPITPDVLVSVNRPGVTTLVVEEPIDYETEVENDADLQAGTTQVRQEGVNGTKATVYEITEDDAGQEVSRSELQSVVLVEPISRIEVRGTKIVAPTLNPGLTVAGDKAALMSAAGIAASDFGFVDFIISHESGWRPFVANSSSGAYGLCQALPASKMATAGADYLTNPVTQLRWCNGYAQGRYGGWANAYAFWQVQRWW